MMLDRFVLTLPQCFVLRRRQLKSTQRVRIDILVSDRFVLERPDCRPALLFSLLFFSLPAPPNALVHLLSEVPRKNDAR